MRSSGILTTRRVSRFVCVEQNVEHNATYPNPQDGNSNNNVANIPGQMTTRRRTFLCVEENVVNGTSTSRDQFMFANFESHDVENMNPDPVYEGESEPPQKRLRSSVPSPPSIPVDGRSHASPNQIKEFVEPMQGC